MSLRPAIRRLAIMLSLALALAALAAVPLTSFIGAPAARADVTVGDIAFIKTPTSGTTTYTLAIRHSDGSETDILSLDTHEYDAQPVVSPDGSKIAFWSRDFCSGSCGSGIMVVNSDGSDPVALTTPSSGDVFVDWFPTWSPDGQWIAFQRDSGSNPSQIWKIRADGTDLTQVSQTNTSYYRYPAWSTNTSGTQYIAFSHYPGGEAQLYTMGTDGSDETAVPDQPSRDNSEAVWAPNSNSRLYFQSYSYGTGFIEGINTDGTSLVQIVTPSSSDAESPTVSGDGSTVAYYVNYTLYSSASDGSGSYDTVPGGTLYHSQFPSYFPAAWPTAPAPSWWGGTTCDTANNSGSAALTSGGVTTSFYGVTACGGGSSVLTDFGGLSVSEYEWQCTELVTRYMYLRWGVPTYVADGYQIVSNYSGSIMTKVTNTGSNLPVVGDVISFNPVSPYDTTHGHTAIVTAVSVTGGSGTITTMEQNNSASGVGTVTVSSGGISTTIVNGWLHHP